MAREERERRVGPTLDALTELPGRAATLEHLADAINAAERSGAKVGVLFIDLDGFKGVNDSFGHAAGDRALVQAAALMRQSARRGDFVGRFGGDEFVAILNVVGDESEMAEAAQRFLDRVVVRVEEEGLVRVIGTSIGVAVYPQDGTTSEVLIDHADHAMYAAKQAGRRSICWFRGGVGRELHARRDLREHLRSADVDRDFLVCYQPIVEAGSMRVIGAEALVRWRHPERGWLAPRTFMPAGVALGISQAIDLFVARGVLTAIRGWQSEGLEVRVHVNISNTDEHVCSELERALEESGDLGPRVAIEIAASAAFADPDRVAAFFRRLRRWGVSTGLDAFAIEPIAFDALASLPIDFIKIGRSVTERAWQDERWKRIARAAIALAEAVEVRPFADGVQNAEQARWLAENGIEAMQGYLFAQPMTAPDFAEWVRASRAEAAEALEAIVFPPRA
jgi:diguanylate cyclase (GGDEF)-like protein